MNSITKNQDAVTALLVTLRFAADKHSRQRRKDSDATPYINHPIAVAEVLARVGKITNVELLQAAILHDTIEDTQTTFQELDINFGKDVRLLVQELSDDKNLPKQERKRLQIEHAKDLREQRKISSPRTLRENHQAMVILEYYRID